MSNIQGTEKLLQYGKNHAMKRFLFVSSGEVYGQGDLTKESFEETYSGYVDPVQVRSCYPSAKRTAETLCAAYVKQYGVDAVIARPCHTFGANVTKTDDRANVQFLNNALSGRDIVLKSKGNQLRSYCYVADCASALITVLLNGNKGEAYNIAEPDSVSTIAEFAKNVADQTGCCLKYEIPEGDENVLQTPIKKQVLNPEKLQKLGWDGKYTVQRGIEHTIRIFKECAEEENEKTIIA